MKNIWYEIMGGFGLAVWKSAILKSRFWKYDFENHN